MLNILKKSFLYLLLAIIIISCSKKNTITPPNARVISSDKYFEVNGIRYPIDTVHLSEQTVDTVTEMHLLLESDFSSPTQINYISLGNFVFKNLTSRTDFPVGTYQYEKNGFDLSKNNYFYKLFLVYGPDGAKKFIIINTSIEGRNTTGTVTVSKTTPSGNYEINGTLSINSIPITIHYLGGIMYEW